jgi:DNA-binding MarR family transcriptional regulator
MSRLVHPSLWTEIQRRPQLQSEVLEDEILAALRRIVRAVDLRSRALIQGHRISGPQLVTLREVARMGPVPVSALARAVNLSQPTVTGILNRLERAGLARRERGARDRRQVLCTVTTRGAGVLAEAPSLLQDRFRRELSRLEEWERSQMLATLQRIASLMDAEQIDAAPVLTTDALEPGEPGELAEENSSKHETKSQKENA